MSTFMDKDSNLEEVLITECPICYKTINLQELPCEHKICKECKEKINCDKKGDKHCPFCRDIYHHIDVDIIPPRIIVQPRNRQTSRIRDNLSDPNVLSLCEMGTILCGCIVSSACCYAGLICH